VLDQDAEYQQVGMSFKDMGFDVLDARSEARICMTLDIPPILVGAKIGLDRATYSNYAEARQAWWEDSLLPLYRNFENVISNDLAPDFGDDVAVEFDFSKVPAFHEQSESLYARASGGMERGYLTINEARDIFLRPNTATEVTLSGELVREPPAPEPGEESPEDEDLTEEAARYLEMERKARGRAPDDAQRREFERRLRQGLEEYFDGQLARIGAAVGEQYQPITHRNGNGTADG
jgi:hypothetical protein